MKYALNPWCYEISLVCVPSYPLDEVTRRLARIGYNGIEIGCAAAQAWPVDLSGELKRLEMELH